MRCSARHVAQWWPQGLCTTWISTHCPLPTYLCVHTRRSGSEVIALQPTLSISALLLDQSRPANYTFVGVVLHRTAHFIAVVRQASGVWHKCDDVYVTPMSEADALSLAPSQGYLLLFERTSAPAKHGATPNPAHGAGTSCNAPGRLSPGVGRKRKAAAGDPASVASPTRCNTERQDRLNSEMPN
mmetsp:Transcript_13252/g.28624  ORF Transcript_13252/g.28624 Transcript_13252/m.28624 type:complete len:185 (-) Transcript_13252:103-657(-)